MRKILVGLAMTGVGAVIAVGARNDFLDRAEEPGAVPAGTSAPAVIDAPAGPGSGGGDRGPALPANAEGESAPAVAPRVETTAAEPAGANGPSAIAQPASESGVGAAPAAPAAPGGADAGAATTVPAPASPPQTGDATGQGAEAEEILRRAAAAYAEVRTLHADFVQQIENPILGSELTSRGTLYQKRPDRFLMRFSDPAGDVIVSDGRYFWVYYPSVDEKQVIRSPAGVAGARGVDLQAQFLGNPLERFTPTLEGKEEVAGRSTNVLLLVPREPVGYRRLKVWVDADDSLVRRFELTETDGRVRRFELRDLEVNIPLDDALFRFTPPAGAHVIDRG